jgi:hypothetical protein
MSYHTGGGGDQLVIGDLLVGADSVLVAADDWSLIIDNVSTNPVVQIFIYSTASSFNPLFFETPTVSLTPGTTVPEPATLGLTCVALTAFGIGRRRPKSALD